ncbi:MAG TPA: hypothetical protein VI793_17230 [Anaerolineales bacterium]|nr:hypothetical protein [Anaerolineales bacterium]
MSQTKFRSAYILSASIAILALVQSAGGLFISGLYRDNLFVTSAWKGNDLVTLAVAVPILVAALILAMRGSLKAQLIWVGVLDYMLYNYAFYLFGAAFNWFFLIYVALLALSIFALIFGLLTLDVNGIGQQFRERTPVKWISGYMMFVAFGLSVIYFAQSLGFIFTGQVPSIVTSTGHPTSVVFALDLTLLVPLLVLGAVWLWKRKSWGYVLAGISTVKGPLYTLVLTVGSLWAANAGVEGAGGEIPLWVFLTVLGLIASGLLFGNMKAAEK